MVEGGARNAFGLPLVEVPVGEARQGVTVATGMALGGLRSTAVVDDGELAQAHAGLRSAAERLAPVVFQANLSRGHGSYHRVADSGCFQLLASTPQRALDGILLARWVAERSLLPGVVATDQGMVADLLLPDDELVRSYLGWSDEATASPSPAQRLLFGEERRRTFAWFDPDHPVATGENMGDEDRARALRGRRQFFGAHLEDLVREGMAELERLTGRKQGAVETHGVDGAELVLVAQGCMAETARTLAELLREQRRLKVGVVSIGWLRPFPTQELRSALAGKKRVVVLEWVEPGLEESPPLLAELRARLGGMADAWSGWSNSRPDPEPSEVLAFLTGDAGSSPAPATPEATGLPKRDALMQEVVAAYPSLPSVAPPAFEVGEDPDVSVALTGLEADLPEDLVERLARSLHGQADSGVRGRVLRPEPGAVFVALRAVRGDRVDPLVIPPRLLVVVGDRFAELGHALMRVRRGGDVLLATELETEALWSAFPAAWKQAVRDRALRLHRTAANPEEWLPLIGSWPTPADPEGVVTIELGDLPTETPELDVPGVIRRIEHSRRSHDSLPRFWGEVLEPRLRGAAMAVPDPLAAAGAVPSCASALLPGPAQPTLPKLDADACTGCGRCWTVCPESAIGATALGTEALLTAASRRAGTAGKVADELRRSHKHLVGPVGKALREREPGAVPQQPWRAAYGWFVDKRKVAEDKRPDMDAALDATLEVMERLQPMATRALFHSAEQERKDSGDLLVLAVDPRACIGCGLCVENCAEDALALTSGGIPPLGRRWADWESLPDTAGASMSRAALNDAVGPLAAMLLSRHAAQAQIGAGEGEPGSGERLAARLVAAAVEANGQHRLQGLVDRIEEARSRVEDEVRTLLAGVLSEADMSQLDRALEIGPSTDDRLSSVLGGLNEVGVRTQLDRSRLQRMTHAAAELGRVGHRLSHGADGLGRARFGMVVARDAVGDWITRYPHNPYHAPLTVASSSDGIELARGVAEALAAHHVELVRSIRRAAVLAENPPDSSARLASIEALRWSDLSDAERASCPPLLLVADEVALLDQGLGSLMRLLDSDRPVKVVLLDGRGHLRAGPEPVLLAMVHRHCFVVAASLGHPDHLSAGLRDALSSSGPAFLHIHAPSPTRHGFAPERTIEQARLAVEARAHILFRYDPAAVGAFGIRASLDGNPALDEDWGEASFVAWAATESRFGAHLSAVDEDPDGAVELDAWLALPAAERADKVPMTTVQGERRRVEIELACAAAERLEVWNTLREVCGLVSPFTDRIRQALLGEVRAEVQSQVENQKQDFDLQLNQLSTQADQDGIARLTERLLQLAGYVQPGGNNA
jgi:pyruvate-ferredoxin/flavodoxin oxidoreductase